MSQSSKPFRVDVITLFPEAFPGVLGHSLMGRALRDGLWELHITDLRDFGLTKHKNVDDTPAGGGAGLVLRPDVLGNALEYVFSQGGSRQVKAMSPRGRPFTQSQARSLSETDGMTLICGRFEGFDMRFIEHYDIEEISIGDFVMTGGEIAAQALIDSTIRLMRGTIGNSDSLDEESFSHGLLEHPQYTKPAEWENIKVPEILLSGNHGEIAKWRKLQSERVTQERRPDLWQAYQDLKGEAEQSDAKKSPPKTGQGT